jgi:uncharacterized protein with HEPN domain
MKKRDDTVYLRHILDSIERIERYIEDLTERGFLDNELRQDAVIRQLSIIGEAVKRLSDDVRDDYPFVS